MFRKISAVLAAFALSLGISFGSAAAASANENAPVAPVVNFTKATVAGETDKLTVTWPSEVPAAEQELYRYLVFIDNNYVLQLNKEFRRQLHTTGIDLAGLQQKYGAALDTYAGTFAKTRYDLNIKVRPFYFDKNKKYTGLAKERHVPAVSGFGGKPVEFIPLGDTAFFKLTDPATLSAPKQTARPNAIDFSLGTMACVAGQPQVDEFLIKLGDNAVLEANHRFVATVDGKSISLNAALRDKLNAEKQLTLADFKAAYPAFDSTTYHGKTVILL